MKRFTIVVIPEGAKTPKQYSIPKPLLTLSVILALVGSTMLGFLILDYWQLKKMNNSYKELVSENQGLKGEARLLMNNLDQVKRSLGQLQDYSEKLSELTSLRVKDVSKKTGIGPLSPDEMQIANKHQPTGQFMPLGVKMNKLVFRPVFDRLNNIGNQASRNAFELQQLLSSISKRKSLLSSVPSITPVNGWITSGYGVRVSPFTGKKDMHRGIDIASPMGSPIYAPADGVVIFTGAKAGYGNFVMIAHGYGIVSSYGHNAQNMVQPGQRVSRGDQIGTVGMTGRATGPHLHYEVSVNGKTRNPKRFILDITDL